MPSHLGTLSFNSSVNLLSHCNVYLLSALGRKAASNSFEPFFRITLFSKFEPKVKLKNS